MVRTKAQVVSILQQDTGVVRLASSQALSTMAFNTGCTSVGDDAITLRMLALPVWYRRAPQGRGSWSGRHRKAACSR